MSNEWKLSRYNIFISDKGRFFVTNTLTGTIVELNFDEFNLLNNNEIDALSAENLSVLKEQGVVVGGGLDEVSLLRYGYARSKFNKEKARLTICTTLECNFACPYCYEKRHAGAMSPEVQNGVIQYVKKIISSGVKQVSIVWYGGEPLLYPDIIEKLSCEIALICMFMVRL